ncbi:hypothetical protein LSH36_1012g00009, partial [Paralvinella palmiformis]
MVETSLQSILVTMFWTDWGVPFRITPAIYKAKMVDGSEKRKLISNRLSYPTGIAIDAK